MKAPALLLGLLLAAGGCGGSEDSADSADPESSDSRSPESESEPASPSEESPTPSEPPADFDAKTVLTGVEVPRSIDTLPDGRRLIADQAGTVVVVDKAWKKRAKPLLDVTRLILEPSSSSPELGLSGFALAPDFADTGVFYTLTTEEARDDQAASATGRVDRLRRWRADPATLTVQGDSRVLLEIPYTTRTHAGGGLVFGDGDELYVAVGASTEDEAALDPHSLVGTILRIIPDETGYTVPADNPYVGGGGREEIFSLGYRNPFRLAWDERIGLVVAEPMFSEKDQQVGRATPGSNAGYPAVARKDTCWTGSGLSKHCRSTANGAQITPPVVEYGSSVGTIVSGAEPVRGKALGLQGKVIVADWSGILLAAQPNSAPGARGPWKWKRLALTDTAVDNRLWDLEVEPDGNVYLMLTSPSASDGSIRQLTRVAGN